MLLGIWLASLTTFKSAPPTIDFPLIRSINSVSARFAPQPPPPDLRVLIEQGNIAPQLTHAPDTYGWALERLDPGGWTVISARSTPTSVPGDYFVLYQGAGVPGVTYQYRANYAYYDNFGWPQAGPYAYASCTYSAVSPRPPYARSCPRTSPCDDFDPQQGGLRKSANPEGRKSDPVNLASGAESYEPEPDLEVYNPTGPNISFQRNWRSTGAQNGSYSEGMVTGWSHNYDIEVLVPAGTGWGGFYLLYPGQIAEWVTAQTSGGSPTGSFVTEPGAAYAVSGTANSTPGDWANITIRWNNETRWEFDGGVNVGIGRRYKISRIRNQTGQHIQFAWSNMKLMSVRDAANSSLLELSYDARGMLSQIFDHSGRYVNFQFGANPAGTIFDLLTVSQVSSVSPKVTYDYQMVLGSAHLKTILTPSPTGAGNSLTTLNYDPASGKVISVIDANGNIEDYTYGTGETTVTNRDSVGTPVFSYVQLYDSQKRQSGIRDAYGYSTSISYDDGANPTRPTSMTDREGRTSSISYDAFGNVTGTVSPRGVSTTATYDYSVDPTGRLGSTRRGTGTPTTFAYYGNGLVQSITSPTPGQSAGTVTSSFIYDSLGNPTSITTPGNNATSARIRTLSYTTDGTYSQTAKKGQPVRVTDELGNFTRYRYDSQGREIQEWDEDGNLTSTTYNAVGDPVEVLLPATGQTGAGQGRYVSSYLWIGGPLSMVSVFNESNVLTRQTTTAYGPEFELLGEIGGAETKSHTYDAAYRLKTLTDGNGRTTTYSYDANGRVTNTLMPGGDTIVTSNYSPEGNLLQRITPNGKVIDYTYADPEGLLTSTTYQSEPTSDFSLTYDSLGRLASRTDGAGSYSWTYGRLDEELTETTTYTGLASRTLATTYHPDGSRASLQSPFGNQTYTYFANGRLSGLTNPASQTTSWTYQPSGRFAVQTLSNTAKTTYSYNALGQLTGLVNATNANVVRSSVGSFTYDGAGNRTGLSITNAALSSYSGTSTHSYDTQDRLTSYVSSRAGGQSHAFGNDAAGNLTTIRGVANTYNVKNQLTGAGYAYDFDGNPTQYEGNTCTYSVEGHLRSYGASFTAGYRADGLMAWSQVGSTRTYYLYDGTTPIFELNSAGALAATNTFGANGLVSRRVGTTSTWYFFDERGNTLQRLNSSQGVTSNHNTDAYGLTTTNVTVNDPWRGMGAQSGYIWFSGIGKYRCGLRFYDPGKGRFMTRDPIGYEGGINLYGYCANNPMMFIDPLGLDWLNSAADFFAGFGDSATFGLTRLIRIADGSDTYVNHNGGWYKGGEAVEFAVELGITGGSAALKKSAAAASRKAVRAEAEKKMIENGMKRMKGFERHHINPLFGHPPVKGKFGNVEAMFPVGGLPAFIHSHPKNLKLVPKSAHRGIHARQVALEALLKKFLKPWAKGAANIVRDCL